MSANTPAACISEVHARIGQQERIERSILFGRKRAEEEALNATRYDEAGRAFLKRNADEWVELGKGNVVSNDTIDATTEWEGMNERGSSGDRTRRGILERKGASTEDIVPSLTQAYRSFDCRLEMVCEGLRGTLAGLKPNAQGVITVTVPGCRSLQMAPLSSCQRPAASDEKILEVFSESVLLSECQPVIEGVLAREAEMLKLATAYHAAYTSLLQFAGHFDLFSGEFRGDLLTPLKQSMSLLEQFSRMPCFLSECRE